MTKILTGHFEPTIELYGERLYGVIQLMGLNYWDRISTMVRLVEDDITIFWQMNFLTYQMTFNINILHET